jgi:hypothetical protein
MPLRVFRRSQEDIIVLWNRGGLTQEQIDSVRFSVQPENGSWQQVTHEQYTDAKIPSDCMGALINQKTNNVNPTATYVLEGCFGVEQPKKWHIKLMPIGQLPDYEIDSRYQHTQVMGWVKDKARWGKIPLVMTEDGILALPVVIMEDRSKKDD